MKTSDFRLPMCRSGAGEFETVTEQGDRNGDGFIDPIVDKRSVFDLFALEGYLLL